MEELWTEPAEFEYPPVAAPVTWTDHRVAELRRLWCQDKSAAHIAKSLGVTRNMVIGKLNRLKLLGNAKSKLDAKGEATLQRLWLAGVSQVVISKQIGVSRTAISQKAAKLGLPPRHDLNPHKPRVARAKPRKRFNFAKLFDGISTPAGEPPLEQRKTLIDLEPHHCRWPFGDPRESSFYFCGANKAAGFSYCAGHLRLSMQEVTCR